MKLLFRDHIYNSSAPFLSEAQLNKKKERKKESLKMLLSRKGYWVLQAFLFFSHWCLNVIKRKTAPDLRNGEVPCERASCYLWYAMPITAAVINSSRKKIQNSFWICILTLISLTALRRLVYLKKEKDDILCTNETIANSEYC